MLSHFYDYTYVELRNSSQYLYGYITGDILPKRDKRNDGSWKIIRYEDLLNLQESYAERRHWNVTPETKEAAASRFISGTVLDSCIYTNLVNGNPRISSQYFSEYYDNTIQVSNPVSYAGGASEWWQAILGSKLCYLLSVPYFGPCSRLDCDKVRLAYYNIEKLTRTAVGLSFGDALISYTNSHATIGSNSSSTSTDSRTDFGTVYSYSSGGRFTQWSHISSVSYIDSRIVAVYPWWLKSAKLLVKVGWTNDSSVMNYEIVPLACSVNLRARPPEITIPDFMTGGFISDVCSRHGIPYHPSTPSYSEDRKYAAVSILGLALVVDNDFKAEIGSLDWDWQPS